jgi:Fe-S cluster biosynthesis and repair protein YggX
LINEKRLNVFEPEAKKFLEEQREKFFNNDESVEKAEGWKPEARIMRTLPLRRQSYARR